MARVTEFGFDEEYAEEALNQHIYTNWPKPIGRMRFVYEIYNQSIEETYFWILDFLREKMGYKEIEKITDLFSASEVSAFFGAAYQKMMLQQDKVSQFLTTIGKMVKELFQLVRELRVMDERLELYYTSYDGIETSEVTLKGYWIEMVEQGAKNPASVYGMSREVQFTTLPDLFFSTFARNSEDVDRIVDKIEFNRKVREVVKRKLKDFLLWKEFTFKELKSRRTFTLKYLRQHYNIIRMYLTWVKPYLKHIERLQLDQSKISSPMLVSAFEGAMVEIEILAKKLVDEKVYSCINAHFLYRTRPEMQSHGYQRNAIHVGRTVMTLRGYVWTKKELEKYQKFKRKEEMDLLAVIDNSIKAAMVALGAELERYLSEAEEQFLPEWERKKIDSDKKGKEQASISAPFKSAAKGFGTVFLSFKGSKRKKCPVCNTLNDIKAEKCVKCGTEFEKQITKREIDEIQELKKEVKTECSDDLYELYDEYKELHDFLHFD